jgi:hypothetical protein
MDCVLAGAESQHGRPLNWVVSRHCPRGQNMIFRVLVDDNFHYMDESERYEIGPYPTAEAALVAARSIVDNYLESAYRPGMTAEQLFESYASFGEDPFIVAEGAEKVAFSAWTYAKERCGALCSSSGSGNQ